MQDTKNKITDAEVVKTNTSNPPSNNPSTDTTNQTEQKDKQTEPTGSATPTTEGTANSVATEKSDSEKTTENKPESSETNIDTQKTENSQAKSNESVLTEDGKEKKGVSPVVAFIAGILTALLLWQVYQVLTDDSATNTIEFADPIAVVNGEPIDQELFETNANAQLRAAAAQGIDITDPTVRNEIAQNILTPLINTEVLVDAAATGDYAPSEEAIQAQIDMITNNFGGEAALNAELEVLGLSQDSFRQDVTEQLSVDTYLQSVVLADVPAITEEEIQAFYDELVASGQEVPALAEIRDAIAAQVQQVAQQELILAHIETLRENAEIEINL